MARIPDLRSNSDITKEHCFVLMDRLEQAMNTIEGTLSAFAGIADAIDVEAMQVFYESQFEPEAFGRLFQNELGKGVLVGTYIQALSDQVTAADLEALEMEGL